MALTRKQLDLVYLGLLAGLGVALAFYATSAYGAGLPTDGMRYISVAESLLKGQGFYDFDQGRLVWFPPLYPLIIAGASLVTRVDVFVVAWYLNVGLWGLNLFLSGWFLRKVFGPGSLYFYLASALVFLSPSALYMHTSVLTEPLFLTFSLLFFFAGSQYLEKKSFQALLWLTLLALGAALLRWAGMSHIVAGGVIVLLAWRNNFKMGALNAAVFGAGSFLPVAAWIYFHNYLPTGTLWGMSSQGNVFVLENLLQAVRKVTYWFIPYRPLLSPDGKTEAVLLLTVVVGLLLAINRPSHWLNWARAYRQPLTGVAMLFTLINFCATTFMAQTKDHRELASDRYYVQSLAFILVIGFLTFEHLIRPHLRFSARQIQIGLVVLVLLWSALPLVRLNKYLQASLQDGEAGYNLHNLRKYHTSDIIAQTKRIAAQEPEASLFSNLPAPVWFFVRKPLVRLIPQNRNWTKDDFKVAMDGWPGNQTGYIIWFTDDPYRVWYKPEDLSLVAELDPVYLGEDGVIYYVSARGQP